MQDGIPPDRPPVTQFRPLHTLGETGEIPPSAHSHSTWTSSVRTPVSEVTAIQAFVRLVSLVSVVEAGELFCIQDAARGGYILARAGEDDLRGGGHSFVPYEDDRDDVPADFSIGPGKALQLHLTNNQMQLVARAGMVPPPALDALGRILEDIILGLNENDGKGAIQWTQPSVLNFPPQERPASLWPGQAQPTQPTLLHHWFEQREMDYPQRVALDYLVDLETGETVQYTYQQLSNVATALAAKLLHLANSESESSATVKTAAVAIGPSPELFVGYVAALKAGLAFCPIPVDAPRDRRERILAELKPVAVLREDDSAATGFKTAVETISVNTFLEDCNVEPEPLPVNTTTSETDAAYILYTSGTTGMPKGVIVSHLSAVCTISALSNHYGFCTPEMAASGRPMRWFQGAAPTFDISLFEIFWTLSTGSTLCCAPRDFTMKNVDKVITTLKADITNVTPSFASLIDPSSLRGLMVGGETVNARLLKDFGRHNPSDKDVSTAVPQGIYNGYGPTEVTIYSVAQAHVPANQRGSVIGTPLATCGVLIVDEQSEGLRPVPMGAVGQLILTGPQVSKAGYLDRPEETSKSFVDDAEWGRAYKTGDRARIVWDEQGQPVVEFLGRINDEQVKLSGRRVELGEIESVLASKVASVRQTVACVWKPHHDDGMSGSERIVSLVVVDPESTADFETVRSQCDEAARHHLPEYMRPFRIFQVKALPRSVSGKIDRKAASAHVRDRLSQQPVSETKPEEDEDVDVLENTQDAKLEAELVEILSAIVDSDSVTATTLLVHVGLDSLRAMRLLRDIRRRWPDSKHMQPSLGSLLDPGASIRSVFFTSASSSKDKSVAGGFTAGRVRAQARITSFASRQTEQALSKLDSVSEADVEMVLPATSTQSQLAVSFAMDRRNYISHTVLPLKANVAPDTLEKAVNAVLERNAIYRCAFVPCNDDLSPFAQVILGPDAWRRWTRSDPRVVRRRGSAAGDDAQQQWLDAAQQYLEFDSQRLYLVQLVHEEEEDKEGTGPGDGLLVISVAHCLCDGPSLEVLREDISREYAGLDPLPRLSVQDAVLDWVSSLSVETDEYWQTSLKDWEPESFHALSGNNVKSSQTPGVPVDYGHAMIQFASDLSWQQLEAKSRTLGASPLSILQAAWSLLLKIFSEANTDDIVFGSVLSGQHEAIHAPTFSVVPCRVPMFDRQTVRELTDFLVAGARIAQGRRNPAFGIFETLPYNTALALQAYAPPEAGSVQPNNMTEVPWTEVRSPAIRYDFDIFAEVFPADFGASGSQPADMVSFKLTYRDDALSETSAHVIVKQFAALTRELLSSRADDIVHTLPARLPKDLLSAEGTIPLPPTEELTKERVDVLHAQFERQAEATPDLLALSFYASLDAPPVELTYAELDARANGLANVLRQEDVEVIPICMQRSVELYVAVLAILKAGSAWSPIDETSPVQRRTSLIARTQGKVLLTTMDSYHLVEPCLDHESLRGVRVLFVDEYADLKASAKPEPRRSIQSAAVGGQDLAYLLWTSGTTGEPKGVMIQHHAAANAMRDLQVRVEHDEQAGQVRTLQLSAYSFDVFVQDLFYTWGVAGSVISGTREIVLGTFTEFVRTARPTHAHLTPSFGASIDVEELAGSTLRYVTFIGEKLTEDVAEAWAAPEITERAYNTYGPAENAVVSTMRRFFGKSRDRAKAANVGFPLTPCTAYVVRQVAGPSCDGDNSTQTEKQWELVPRYGVGELALGGAQVAKGYLNNEAKTTAAFIQGGPGIDERIYLTGDMVRLNDHGFEFLGRNDDLVKITGIRIELSEISAACAIVKADEPAVEHVETLHLPRPGQGHGGGGDAGHKVVVTFVSVKRGHGIVDTDKIRTRVFQKARDVLPAYMVPGHVVVLDTTMPRTASNKVDRKALQSIYNASDLNVLAGRHRRDSMSAPVGETRWSDDQVAVLTAVAESFAVPLEPLDPNDSLAGLGFSSLQVTKLAWTLRRKMKCAVGVLDLMRCQTLGELVGVVMQSIEQSKVSEMIQTDIEQAQAPTTNSPSSWLLSLKKELTSSLHGDLRPKETSYILPVTPVQESLLVETMIEPGAYWSHRIFDLGHLGEEVDTARLKAAWTAAASHLDILRTVFCPLSHFSVADDQLKSKSDSSVGQWAREHGIYAAVLQLVLDTPYIHWTTLHDADADTLADLAKQIQLELSPLSHEASPKARPPWAVTFSEGNNQMMLSMHHALHDAESSSMLLDMVAKLYRDLQQSSVVINDATTLQMARGMELGLLTSLAERDEACSAWSKRLQSLAETDGPLNAPFPDLTGSRQKQTRTILSAKASVPGHLLEARRRPGLPDLPRLMQSAFGCILAAVLELKTVVLGQTVSQRVLHPDLARVAGPAMATLPVVVRAHAPTANELWAEMNRDATSTLGATAHSLHPVDVKKMINQGSGESNAPFPALFVYHPSPEAEESGGVDAAERDVFKEVGQALSLNVEHSMALNIFEVDNTLELTGDSRVISQPMLDLMLQQILNQARVMLENPNVPLDQLQNYMDRELVAIVGEPATFVGKDIATNPAALVTKQATEHPEWIAVEEIFLDDADDDDGSDSITTQTLTYRELEVLVNAIASKLTSHEASLQPGDVVALYLERDIKSLAAIIAIFKCGYIYLPIDEGLPSARKQLLVRDANAKLVVTTESMVEDLDLVAARDDPPALLLPEGDDELEVLRSWPDTVSGSSMNTGGDGGYLLYTSGSTGRPKGVQVTNESLLHWISAMTKCLIKANAEMADLGGVGKYLNVASRAFDTHLTSMFAPWHLGLRSVIGKDRDGIFASLEQVVNTVGITNMGSVPSVLLQLGLRLDDMPSMRILTFGGEKASHELFEQLTAGNPKAALMNFYGPTEATVGCLSHVVGHHSNARNLGLPLPGLEALLLVPGRGDDEQVVARKGEPGEFCIAGPQVAVGYLNRPEENAKGFQHTTLLGGGRRRIYRSGDMMRMMHDGTVEFLGRKDQQTKIRGQRFEIGEVEAFIKKTVADQGPLDVAAAVVDQRLLGFLARRRNTLLKAELDAEPELISKPSHALRAVLEVVEQSCQRELPAFMVPEIMWVSKVPLLAASGKTDTKLLVKLGHDFLNLLQGPDDDSSRPTATVTTAMTEAEREVLAALEEVMGRPVVATPTSVIRNLGIDSLSGMHLLSVLKKRGFVKVSLADLLSPSCSVASLGSAADVMNVAFDQAPTNASLPVKEMKMTLRDLGPGANGLTEDAITDILPCLPLQSALVALSLNWLQSDDEATGSEPPPYVTEFNYELAPGTDIARWKHVAEQIVSSEAMLRTCFVQREEDGRIFQVVLKSPPSPFEGHDDAAAIVLQMNSRPPVRLQITESSSSGSAALSLKIHHSLYDGAAIAMLRNKIEQIYARDSLPVLSDQQSLSTLRRLAIYCDLTPQEMRTIESSWKTNLLGVEPCRVGADIDKSKQATTTHRASRRLAYTAAELKTKLQRNDGQTVSVSTALQLATTLCLASLTRSRGIVYGFTLSLRPLLSHVAEGINDFVGPCLNTIVHASILTSADETLPHLADRIHRSHADACRGKMPLVGVDKIQRWAGVEEKLFNSLLTINVLPTDDELVAGREDLPGGMLIPLPGKANIDMALAIDIDLHPSGEIDLALASAGVLTAAQLQDLAALFEEIVLNSANDTATVEQFASGVSYETPPRMVSAPIPNGESTHLVSSPSDDGFHEALSSVRGIACRLLSLDEAGIDQSTSLYRLGLDSINVLPFVKLINKSEAIKITAGAVLRAKTLQGVADLVHRAKDKRNSIAATNGHKEGHVNGKPTRVVAQSADNSQTPYEQTLLRVAGDLLFVATPLQEGMLSASMALADQAYVYTHTMRLSDAAREHDAPRFERFSAAVRDTVQACEILRTRFIFTNHDDAPWVGVVSPTEQSDLFSWKISENGLVQLKIHHALYDANSIRAIWRLLNDNYAKQLVARREHHDDLGPTKHHLFLPFAKLSAAAQRSSIAFWMDALQDYAYTPVQFSVDGMHASSAFYFSLSDADLLMLQAKCRQAQVSPKTAMQVAWAKLLCEAVYKQADVVFGEVIMANQDNDDDDDVVMGPTINTVPLRIKFSSQRDAASIEEAMSRLQTTSDNARGENGMASLRAIQTAWRSSRPDGVDTSAGIFQSLFVYDGVMSSSTGDESPKGPLVPAGAAEQADAVEGDKGPAYDDYPLIVSFRIRDGKLHGALRAKMSEAETNRLGTQLETALRYVVSRDLQDPALGSHLQLGDFPRKKERVEAKTAVNGDSHLAKSTGLQNQADAIVEIVKKAVGSKLEGKKIALNTKMINIGLDSISAIRFSKMLRKQMGIHMSVFEIIRGASVYDIVMKSTSRETNGVIVNRRNDKVSIPDGSLKTAVAGRLGVAEDQIETVSTVLSGQRGTLRQWLHSGKRFFEAPWVYSINDSSINEKTVAINWESLCQAHEILRTTFVCAGGSAELLQVTFDERVPATSRLTTVRDTTIPVQELIQKFLRKSNAQPSDLTKPPARLSFLEASDGKAVVLRVHHALYDAWSIKMILKDLVSLFDHGSLEPRPSVRSAIQEIIAFRHPKAEQEYWTQHLSRAQDTILESEIEAADGTKSPLRPHFKSHHADVIPQDVADSLANMSRTQLSVAVIVAYARALGQLTGRARPTFGFNYSSRALSSATGEQTLDLTSMSIPTMTVVPFTLDLETTAEQGVFEAVRDHLAQLTKFAQADGLEKLSPRFNTHINILYSEGASDTHTNGTAKTHALQRLKLGEPLASEYFTTAAPSSILTTVDGLDTSFMPNQQLYFNVLVRQNGNINVDISGEEGLLSGDQGLVPRFVESFSAEFVGAIRDK